MAELPLLEYVAQIESQLNAGAADEASYHSRHILSLFPKYAAAFRLLGRALLLKGQYDEAEAAFRRVLGAYPADLAAHLSLAELYDQRQRGDEAIWHAERALEVGVNRSATTDLISALYRRYRNENRPRMGLTAVTLARQALQKRDYDQAISTLRDSLEHHPQRIDQRLLLAEAIWAGGDHVGAAEVATDVLDKLPDCVSANALLARLWLEVGRPSDARPYLSRVESLDPYLAVEIVTARPVEPDAFMIEPINYQHTAQSDVARMEPDWVQNISADEGATTLEPVATNWASGMLNDPRPAAESDTPALPDRAATAEDAPTLSVPVAAAAGLVAGAALASQAGSEAPPAEQGPSEFDTLFTMPTTMLNEPAATDAENYSVTAILDDSATGGPNLFAEPSPDNHMPEPNDIFGDFPDATAPVPPFAERAPEFRPVAPAGATAPLPPLADPFAPEPMPQAEDAMAWLRESGVELVEDEAPEFSIDTGAEFPSESSPDELDPMAWLTSYDTVQAGADSPTAGAGAVSGLGDDWQAEQWDPNAVNIADFSGAAPADPVEDLIPSATTTLRGLTSRLGDPSLAAPPAQAEPAHDDEALSGWLAEFGTTATPEPDEDSPGWLNELGAEMTTDPERTPAAPEEHSPDDEAAGWLTEFSPDNLRADLDAVVAETGSDWLAEATAAPEAGATADDAGLPDWLASAAPDAAGAVAAAMAGERPDLDAIPTDDEFDWLTSLNEPVTPDASPAAELDEAVLAAQADVPDWLDALESEALAQIDANQIGDGAEVTGGFEEAVVVEAFEPLPFDEAPAAPGSEEAETDWLAAGPVAAGAAVAGVAAVAAAGWDESAEAPPAEEWAAEVPADSEALPLAVAEEAITEAEISEIAEAEAVAEAEVVAEAEAVADAYAAEAESNWLTEAVAENEEAPDAAAPAGETPEPAPFDWGEPETADLARIAPPTVGVADLPPAAELPTAPDDWFADGSLAAEAPVPADGTVAALHPDDWYVDASLNAPVEAEAAELPAIETVAVLAESEEPVAESDEEAFPAEGVALVAGAGALGVLAVASTEETETAPGDAAVLDELDEDEEWLAADWQEDAEAPFLQADELDELPDVEIAEETLIAPATNAPDWLNAMVPGLDLDFDAAEDEVVETEFAESSGALDETLGARSEYAWVIDLVEQEEMETAPAEMVAAAEFEQPRFVFRSLPAWYLRDNGNGSDDDDFADWPSDDSSLPAYQN